MDLDVALPSRPDQSTPVNMPPSIKATGHGRVPVLIEASSASSFELSPRFSNAPFNTRHASSSAKDSTSSGQMDLENELQEAMTETVVAEESLDGEVISSTICPRHNMLVCSS